VVNYPSNEVNVNIRVVNTDLCWSNGEINRKLELKTSGQLFCIFIHYHFPFKTYYATCI